MHLHWKYFALAVAFTWALAQLVAGWGAALGRGIDYVEVMSSLYVGFKPTFVGGIIGALWGFLDGLIFGGILGYIYNSFLGHTKVRKKRR